MKTKLKLKVIITLIGFGILQGATVVCAGASGVTLYEDGERYLKLSGNIQVQYRLKDPEDGPSTDKLFFRRLRPTLAGSIHKDWFGRIDIEVGNASGDNEVSIKNTYIRYDGIENVRIKVGNYDFPFSRELLTSSKKQQLVERTLVGDHNYGVPDKNLGLHLLGRAVGGRLTWRASVASGSIDPDEAKIDFDSPVNKRSDFNEGWMIGGRVDVHPFGLLKFSQGDFKRDELRATAGAAAYYWTNDDDVLGHTADLDQVTGFEVSGALRYMGLSVDAQRNLFNADAKDPSFTGGLFRGGSTELANYSIEGGYMIVPSRLELVAGYQAQDADNYAETWTRTSLGVNYFFQGHDIKLQCTYRMGENLDGVNGNDRDEIFVQAQHVF